MLKKALALVLVIALTATIAITGTVAYLQSEDSDVNVMTLGSVKIEQNEQQRVEENGEFTAKLEPFQQGKLMMPYVSRTDTPDVVTIGDFTAIFNDQYANYIDKIVTVTNTGKSDAYVRTLIALPSGGWEEQESASDNWLHWNTWGKNPETGDYDMDATWDSCYDNAALEMPTVIEIDGMEYQVYEFVHTAKLAAGATACPTLTGVYMDCRVNNDDTGYYMDRNSNNKYDADTEERIDIPVGEPVNVYVLSQAVQTEGFADAFTALDTAFGDVNAANAAEWFGGIKKLTYAEDAEQAADAIVDAAANGGNVLVDKTVDIVEIPTTTDGEVSYAGNGSTITMSGTGSDAYGYLAFVPEAGEDATVEDLTVTGSGFVEVGHYGQGGGEYTVNNLTVKDMTATLCVNNGGNNISAAFSHYGTATLTDCVMTGTVSVNPAYTAYDAAFVNGTKTTINGGEYGKIYLANQAKVTISDAKIGQIDSYAIKTSSLGQLVIGSGTEVGTINLRQTGNYPPILTIEAGAKVDVLDLSGITNKNGTVLTIADNTVGKIVADGTEYASIDAWKAAQ